MAGGGGSQTVKQDIPQYIEDASKRNMQVAERVAQLGYVPYFGPDVAAATPQMMASWNGVNQAASAFGMPTAAVSTPQAQNFGNGVMGYSSAPLYEAALAELKARRPGKQELLSNIFANPSAAPVPQPGVGQPAVPTSYPSWYRDGNSTSNGSHR